MEKISIIIPTYNRAKVIKKTVESALNQTHNNIEVIVVDDGSNDNTSAIIKKIKDSRVKYIKLSKNNGVCNARNIGIKEAIGNYIAFQDSDNIMYKYKLEKQLNNLIKSKSDIDLCKVRIINNNDEIIFPLDNQEKAIKDKKIVDELCNGNFIDTNTILIKRNIMKENLFDQNTASCEDYDLLLKLAPIYKISYTSEVLVDNIIQDTSLSMNYEVVRKAVLNMLNKDYKLNRKQRIKFNSSLVDLIISKNNILSNNRINKLQEENNNLLSKIEELENKINVLEYHIDNANKVLNEIFNSLSWKITKPLRFIKNIGKKN